MSTTTSPSTSTFPAIPYISKHTTWPYHPADFQRADSSPDKQFYSQPRLVTHIDDPSIARLTRYYDAVLPRKGAILDMCASWKSFYPVDVKEAVHKRELDVYGVGLNAEELSANQIFRDEECWRIVDLNQDPHDPRSGWDGKEIPFDAVTCGVSIDYLVQPLEVCAKVRDAMKDGGVVHFVISNRCFPTKVVKRWMMLDEAGRLELVGDYLHFSGWKDVEIVDLCARDENGKRITDDHGTVLVNSPHIPDHLDPLWVIRATKRT